MDHATRQLAYFASIDHAKRFRWQTEDAFVMAHEHETLRPLVEQLRHLHMTLGRPLSVLESGCGEGVNMVHLRQLGVAEADVTLAGVDLSAEAVAEAQRHGLNAQVGDGLHLPFADASFDVAYCRDVFHHLASDDDRRRFFSELSRVVRPGGLVIAIEPNASNLMIFFLSVCIQEEKGLRSIRENRMTELFPGASVTRIAPSAAWRFFLHFHSPVRSRPRLKRAFETVLSGWEALCRAPWLSRFWSYRVYCWKKE